MLLIVGKSRGSTTAAREIFFGMGIICEICDPVEVELRLSVRHSTVLAVGRELEITASDLCERIRRITPRIPIIALREDIFSENAKCFDAVYPNSLYCTAAISKMREISVERGVRGVGEYSIPGISAFAGAEVFVGDKRLLLTKSEAAVLRTVIAFHPEGISAEGISAFAFRYGREPSSSGVRTHICAINKKLSTVSDISLSSARDGYVIKHDIPITF